MDQEQAEYVFPLDRHREYWVVACAEEYSGCGAEAIGKNKRAAIAAWNRRVDNGTSVPVREESKDSAK